MSRESSNTIQAQAVARAVRLLEAAGARFAVEFQGEAMGNADHPFALEFKRQRDLLPRHGQPADAQERARHRSIRRGKFQHCQNGDPQRLSPRILGKRGF